MPFQIVRATAEHVPTIARIIYQSFDEVSRRHGFTSEIVAPPMAEGMAAAFVQRLDIYGVVAVDGGDVIGHNFLQISDAVAGVGPINVDSARQCAGVGRALMQHVIEWGQKNHGPQIRLVQEAFNMASLSLYASLGFDVVEPLAAMTVPPRSDAACRALTPADIPATDVLCLATQKVSRKRELLGMIASGPAMGCVPHGRFVRGRLTALCVPGFFGFGAAESADDLLTCCQAAVGALPPPLQKILLPIRNGELFRAALARGCRTAKVLQLMAMGPYESPTGFWAPSIAY